MKRFRLAYDFGRLVQSLAGRRRGSPHGGLVQFSRASLSGCISRGLIRPHARMTVQLVSPISSAAFIGDARSQANICLTLDVIVLGVELAEAYGRSLSSNMLAV